MSVIGGILAVLFSCVSSSGIAVTNNASNDNVDVDENNNDNDGMNTVNNNSNNNSNNNIARLIESVGVVVTTIVWTIAWGFITFGEGPVRYVKLHDMFSYVFPMSLLPYNISQKKKYCPSCLLLVFLPLLWNNLCCVAAVFYNFFLNFLSL